MKRLMVGVVVAGLVSAASLSAEIVEQIVVKVNGEIMTKTELEERQVAAIRARNRTATAEDLKNDAQLQKALEEITPQLLVDAVDEMLVLQQGRERGYRLTDERFQGIVERIRKENKLETDEQFQAALKQEGMSMDDLRRNMERSMVVNQIQNEAVGRVQVADDEAQKYYAQHQGEFTTPASLTLREILVEVPTGTTASGGRAPSVPSFNVSADESAEARAQDLRKRITGGEDFAKLAGTDSDAPSKANGGLIGPVNVQDLTPALRDLVTSMKVGDVSEPIRTPRGYQVFKLESMEQATVLPFDKSRDQIVNKVYQEKRAVEFRKFMQKLRDQAIIEWKNAELQKVYEEQMKTAAPPAPAATKPS